ncbi:MAG: hypothetical protein ACE361_06375 [Aureliella sp.]
MRIRLSAVSSLLAICAGAIGCSEAPSNSTVSRADTADVPQLVAAAPPKVLVAPPLSEVSRSNEIDAPTHRQSTMIKPELNGQPIRLNTFCLSKTGMILAACGGKQTTLVPNDAGSYDRVDLDEPPCLIEMDSVGSMVRKWDLGFQPTAVNLAPNGDIFVAGMGEIARIHDGEIVATGTAPHMGNIEEFTAKAVKQAEEQAKQFAAMYDQQIDSLKERITKIEETEESERTRVQTAQLDAFKQQLEMYETISEQQVAAVEPEAVVAQAKGITSVAVSDQDVFWVCKNVEGSGYTIWRTNHDFEEGVAVVSSISGCCGQMDIQSCDDNLVIAENTSYKVGIYDRDGKKVNDFGMRDRSSKAGFGSCCNPMNVRPLPDGTVLTAESSIGHIKRFDAEGNFLEYIGKAKVAGGCKHCSVAYDSNSDQYYMMHEDESAIIVLSNQSSLPSQTDEEKLIAKLHQQFDGQLLGTWEIDEATPAAGGEVVAVSFGGGDSRLFEKVVFQPTGKLETSGGAYASIEGDWTWEIKEGDDESVTVDLVNDQVQFTAAKFTFADGEKATIAFEMMGSSHEATRTEPCTSGCETTACGEECQGECGEDCKKQAPDGSQASVPLASEQAASS